MIITFPQGQEVNVEYDDAAHSYVVAHKLADGHFSDFRPTHGATAPLVVVPKPYLKAWAAKESTNATLRLLAEQPLICEKLPEFIEDLEANLSKAKDPETGKTLVTDYRLKKMYPWYAPLKKASDSSSDDGKEMGTWLHKAIEDYYNSDRKVLPVLTPAVEPMWQGFLMFDNYEKPSPDPVTDLDPKGGVEFLIYSLMFGYSGQGDFRGRFRGKNVILDWKTTNRSYSNPQGITIEYFFQMGGLAQAEFERTGVWVDDLGAVNFDKKGGDPQVVMASEFGMSPQDAARAYISCFNNYHMVETWDYKYKKR